MTKIMSFFEALPPAVGQALERWEGARLDRLEEVRLRAGRQPGAVFGGREEPISGLGPVTAQALQALVNRASDYSAYAAESALAQGYLTLPGGHRLGICGRGVMENGQLKTLRELGSVNLRIARACPGTADGLRRKQSIRRHSLLILGPPGSGKTTLLRDLVRQLSDVLGARVSLADERGEVAAVWQGVPQLDVGRRTDVLTGCPKAQAAGMLLRTMNPEYLAMDEITQPQDLEAIRQGAYCGVNLLATAHAGSREDLSHRPLYRDLIKLGIFDECAVLRPGDKTFQMEALT